MMLVTERDTRCLTPAASYLQTEEVDDATIYDAFGKVDKMTKKYNNFIRLLTAAAAYLGSTFIIPKL